MHAPLEVLPGFSREHGSLPFRFPQFLQAPLKIEIGDQ